MARKNNILIAYNNLVGGQDELVFDGHSLVINKNGGLLASGKQFEEDLVVADIELPKKKTAAKTKRINIPCEEKTKKPLSNAWIAISAC